eukprot:CAMPEP_0197314376 /NCGR_PEP_ID=MMETSP0891-20130614/33570_1 /TAXON_ID=44058 ORGANISM="Aureoumbra lagunensis, Strain CCMP1510" /NCGR_SAMPLE_ID=MMETSP0891 /ASSEMBLY_ACC=CAM_ASM_000534 /LENGTH=410 /DNA_ID=CAMNT_0042802785 /DNA_START=166 /DNA_END=1398 /DNA_ORIENTATION=-
MSNANFLLGVLALLYSGICVVLLVLNHADHNDDECDDPDEIYIARCGSATSDLIFHRLEMWTGFCFALITVISLNYSPKAASNLYDNPLILKLVLLVEVCLAAVPALLVTINLEFYEVPSHELEYLNELTVSFVDIILLTSLLRLPEDEEEHIFAQEESNSSLVAAHFKAQSDDARGFKSANKLFKKTVIEEEDDDEEENEEAVPIHAKKILQEQMQKSSNMPLLATNSSTNNISKMKCCTWISNMTFTSIAPMVAAGVATLQLIIYNLPMDSAEMIAHYFEFSFGIISAFVTFWFCMDNRFACESEIMEILHGTHKDCINCKLESRELSSMRVDKASKRPSVALALRRTIHRAFNPENHRTPSVAITELPNRRPTGFPTISSSASSGNAAGYDACLPQKSPLAPVDQAV